MTDFGFTEEDVVPAPIVEPEPFTIHKVQTKPLPGLAVKASTDNLTEVVDWITGQGHHAVLGEGQVTIQTLEGPFTVRPGDWAVYVPEEGFKRCDGELFGTTYDDLGVTD